MRGSHLMILSPKMTDSNFIDNHHSKSMMNNNFSQSIINNNKGLCKTLRCSKKEGSPEQDRGLEAILEGAAKVVMMKCLIRL